MPDVDYNARIAYLNWINEGKDAGHFQYPLYLVGSKK